MSTTKPFKVLIAHTDVPPEGIEILKEQCEILQVINEPPKNRPEILEKIRGLMPLFGVVGTYSMPRFWTPLVRN